jgi:hypothetical protein
MYAIALSGGIIVKQKGIIFSGKYNCLMPADIESLMGCRQNTYYVGII